MPKKKVNWVFRVKFGINTQKTRENAQTNNCAGKSGKRRRSCQIVSNGGKVIFKITEAKEDEYEGKGFY